MAEAYMNAAGAGKWRAYSAGSTPTGQPNPFALQTLARHAIPVDAPQSKSWNAFAEDDAPVMDVIVTVCDNAAGEVCPLWPSKNGTAPANLHWSFPDPAAASGDDAAISTAFETVFTDIRAEIDAFLSSETK